jgi:hypothetical protein
MLNNFKVSKLGLGVHICDHNYTGGGGWRINSLRPVLAKIGRPCLKSKIKKPVMMGWGHSSSSRVNACTCKVLYSIPGTAEVFFFFFLNFRKYFKRN